MAIDLALEPKLVERVLQLSGERTRSAAVTKALEEYIARREQKHLVGLFDALDWDNSFDYKSERSMI